MAIAKQKPGFSVGGNGLATDGLATDLATDGATDGRGNPCVVAPDLAAEGTKVNSDRRCWYARRYSVPWCY